MNNAITTHHAGKKSYETLQQELEKTRSELADAHAEINSLHATEGSEYTLSLDETKSEISDGDRRRLLGSGVRRYGFIDKVSDVMVINEDFSWNPVHY